MINFNSGSAKNVEGYNNYFELIKVYSIRTFYAKTLYSKHRLVMHIDQEVIIFYNITSHILNRTFLRNTIHVELVRAFSHC